MLFAYSSDGRRLQRIAIAGGSLAEDTADATVVIPDDAIWIDLYRPLAAQVEAVARLGIDVPTLADMEEIEISNRLYHEDGADNMTVVVPGLSASREAMAGPVTFILTKARLVTVRHHAPRPFETYPERADRGSAGCASPDHVFLGLVEEIVSRLADLLEAAGRVLDDTSRGVFGGGAGGDADLLQKALEQVGQQGELIGRVRLAILTMERALSFYGTAERGETLRPLVKGAMRDLSALSVHADFLSSRVGLTVDATLGMINLAQNATVRIVSVVAVLFLPPTLVASIYGMNFHLMPELDKPWGYPAALGLMLASALGTYLWFKWKHWL